MNIKKSKTVIAALISASIAASSVMPSAYAAGTRNKAEKYGDDSYAARFLSLYDDVITNGSTNGYLSSNKVSGGFGIPYYAPEELCIEDRSVDHGHETTFFLLSANILDLLFKK